MPREIILWGGLGEKKSNNGKQHYVQNRIYDSNGISPAITGTRPNYLIIISMQLINFLMS